MAISGRRREVVAKAVRSMQTGSAEIHGVASDIATAEGCAATLEQALAALGGLDVLVNNAGAVRGCRRENTDEAELQAMIHVTAPILLTRAAPPVLRNSGDAMMVNVSSGNRADRRAALRDLCHGDGWTCLFRRNAAARVEKRGIHVLTVSSPAGRTPMMKSNRAGSEPGFTREPASAVADAIAEGIETGAFEVIRSGQAAAQMVALNRENPGLRSTSACSV